MSSDLTTGEKIVRIVVKSGLAGLVGGVAVRVVFGEVKGKVSLPMFGKATIPIAIGTTVGLAKATAEIVDEFFLDDETRDELDKTLCGMFSLALGAGATLLVGWLLLPKYVLSNMTGYLKLAAVGGVAVISADWLYDTFLEGVIDDFSKDEEAEDEVPEV